MAIQRVITFEMTTNAVSSNDYNVQTASDRTFLTGATTQLGFHADVTGTINNTTQASLATEIVPPGHYLIYGTPTAPVVTYRSTTSGNLSFGITDNNRLVVGCFFRLEQFLGVTECIGFSGAGATRVTFGVNGRFLAIYVDGTPLATSTLDALDAGWVYVELFIDKTVPRAYLYADGVQIADTAISAAAFTGVTFYANTLGNGHWYADSIIVLDAEFPRGPIFAQGYVPAAIVSGQSQFTGSLATVQTRPFVNATFRESTTANNQDMYTYNQINTGKLSSSIVKFVRQQVVASSSGAGGGQLNLRFRVASTDYDTSVTSLLTSTNPTYTQGPAYQVNPNTGAAWTFADIQTNVANGYVVKA